MKNDKLGQIIMYALVLITTFSLLFNSCENFYDRFDNLTGIRIEDDNFIEEKGEEIVKEKLGIDQDWTPASPE